jgi:hypothetical protein
MMETFHPKKDLVSDNCNFLTACTTLPTLQEGHVIGNMEFQSLGTAIIHFDLKFCLIKNCRI